MGNDNEEIQTETSYSTEFGYDQWEADLRQDIEEEIIKYTPREEGEFSVDDAVEMFDLPRHRAYLALEELVSSGKYTSRPFATGGRGGSIKLYRKVID